MASKKTSFGKVLLEIVSILCMVIILIPVVWMIVMSLKTEGQQISNTWQYFTPPYTLQNYATIFQTSKVLTWLLNSLYVALIVTALVIIISTMAAFALAKIRFRYRKFMYFFFLLGLMVPTEATIVPLFVAANRLGLIDTYLGLILPALAGSMNIVIMRSFFMGIPDDLIESATIDGANELYIFLHVILPLGRTVIVTIAIFTFIGNWNSYLWPYLAAMSEDLFTLPLGIPTFIGQYTQDKVLPMTINTIASVPIIIFFIVFEKQIVKGISLSGIKG